MLAAAAPWCEFWGGDREGSPNEKEEFWRYFYFYIKLYFRPTNFRLPLKFKTLKKSPLCGIKLVDSL